MLSIGILVDSSIQEAWVLASLLHVREIDGVELKLIAVATGNNRITVPAVLHSLVDRVDYRLRCAREPLFKKGDIVAALGLPELRLSSRVSGDDWVLDADACRSLIHAQVDLWLCASRRAPRLADNHVARHGVWGIEIGDGMPPTNVWAGAAEIAANCPVTAISVRDYTRDDNGSVLLRSIASTKTNSSRRNRLQAVRKASWMYHRLVARLVAGRHRPRPGALPQAYPVSRAPSMDYLLQLAARLLRRIAGNQLLSLRWQPQWQLAYYFGGHHVESVDVRELRYLLPPADRFWADPFAVEHEGRHYIFFEELLFKTWMGRLMGIEVRPDGDPGEPFVVLERPYHLSYPFVFRWNETLYLLPETAEAGRLELYRCVRFPDQWQLDRVLLENVKAYDATLWQDGDTWWMFVSIALPELSDGDELHLFHGDAPTGPWHPHPQNPVVSDARTARPAGPMYRSGSKLYRPSQDCSSAYGYAIVINRVMTLNKNEYEERPVTRISPAMRDDFLCVHTVGNAGPLHVVDYQVLRKKSSR